MVECKTLHFTCRARKRSSKFCLYLTNEREVEQKSKFQWFAVFDPINDGLTATGGHRDDGSSDGGRNCDRQFEAERFLSFERHNEIVRLARLEMFVAPSQL